MVEVPAAALMAGHLARLVDFFSIGSNDLTQYVLAAERGSARLAALQDPLHPAVLAVLDELGEPITSTSANLPGEPPAATAEAVRAVLDALAPGEPVWILDAGPLPPSLPSTVLAVTGGRPRLLRAGAVSVDELRQVVGEIDELG